ncbi:hypothetical protein AHiyo4_07330 [Arthrobacter sp. Hiyo4]|nr:hypothetical protein AHiyo4_07330 [Arthrobacter sp. Hiyo4]
MFDQPFAGQGRLAVSPFLQRPLVVSNAARPISLGMPHNHQAFDVVVAHASTL